MGVLKNLRHERFAREYVKTGCASEAYRRVYPKANPRNTAWANSARLLGYASVKARVVEVRQTMLKRSDITLEKLLTDLETAKQLAHRLEKTGDMTNATMAQAKLVGLLRDRIEAGNVGDFDNAESIADILEQVANQIGPEKALALAEAWGLNKQADNAELEQAKTPTDSIN